MYSYIWDTSTNGYLLSTTTGSFIASELRPVFAEELLTYGFQNRLKFNHNETAPLLWAQKNNLFYNGEKIISLDKIEYGRPISATYFFNDKKTLKPLNIQRWLKKNGEILDALVFDTLKRIKEMYDQNDKKCDIKYIAFSGGKDSMLLLDLCHRVLPLTVPVVFSDTDMELSDTYHVWEDVQKDKRYKERPFIKVKAEHSALENWKSFGPPSRVLRWCCSVHKSAPAILTLVNERAMLTSRHGESTLPANKLLCFVGIRGDESLRRAEYGDIGDGKKSNNQIQAMPILGWSSHELWLYTFRENLIINKAYRKGIPRVGCILCPQTSKRQVDLIRKLYPDEIRPFAEEIVGQSSRPFETQVDADNFVYEGGWHARKNGTYLTSVIDVPAIEQQENQVAYTIPKKKEKVFLEWLKIIGHLIKYESEKRVLHCRNELVDLEIKPNGQKNVQFLFSFQNTQPNKIIISHLSRVYYKTLCCIGCRSCEAECFHGAMQFNPFSINIDRCTHCLRCNENDNGCLVFHSRRNTKGTTMTISGIGKYQTFGLQPAWIAKLIEHNEMIRENFGAGKPMVSSAIAWFKEAGLIEENANITVTPLLGVAEKFGTDNLLFWQLIWLRLVNYSPLVKWFVCETNFSSKTNKIDLHEKLSLGVSAKATRDSGLTSLFALFKNSPLGSGNNPLIHLEFQGKTIQSLTRLVIEPEPLAVLYGLYLAASLANRNTFSIREMQQTDFEMPCIFPIAAFGLSRDSFVQIVNGLTANYPSFISGSFTHGLDEVRLYTNKSSCDVIELVLNNNDMTILTKF